MVSKSSVDHEFGGLSTDLKLSMVEDYLSAFTTALRKQFHHLIYIDAFAGTGVRTVKYEAQPANIWEEAKGARIERLRGSAQIALDVTPRFDELVFIDQKRSHYRALCELRDANSNRNITVERGDANAKIAATLGGRSWAGTRGVIFLDPYGMHVDWKTLEVIRQTEAFDVWYLVSLEGLYRQAPRERSKLTARKREAINRMVGTDDWEDAWYADPPDPFAGSLFADDPAFAPAAKNAHRTAEIDDIAAYMRLRLKSLFPAVLEPLVLRNNAGARTFLLFFAMANPQPRAMGLATKIANHILKAGRSSQVLPR